MSRERHQQAQVVVRMPIELRDQAEAFAKKNDRTLAQRKSAGALARERGFAEHNQGPS